MHDAMYCTIHFNFFISLSSFSSLTLVGTGGVVGDDSAKVRLGIPSLYLCFLLCCHSGKPGVPPSDLQ